MELFINMIVSPLADGKYSCNLRSDCKIIESPHKKNPNDAIDSAVRLFIETNQRLLSSHLDFCQDDQK